MIRSLYTSAWSMQAKSKQMDVISNNLANVNTTGFKKDVTVFESFSDVLARRINDKNAAGENNGEIGTLQMGSDIGMIYTNYKGGSLIETDAKMDLALDLADNAFFTVGVQNESGEYDEFYTRDGGFGLNAEGYLVTKNNEYVMGDEGPIQLNTDNFNLQQDGSISVNDQVVANLKITQFTDTNTLRKVGKNLITKTEQSQTEDFSGVVRQGFLEQSNVNSVSEMVEMISAMRSYEASQKLLQFMDGTLEKVTIEVGAVR